MYSPSSESVFSSVPLPLNACREGCALQATERLAAYLARELALDSRKADVLRFGAKILFSTSLGIVAMALAGYLLGCLAETMAAAAAGAVIRNFAGDAHCSTT
jgi:accessory gene regulator protein AgrB